MFCPKFGDRLKEQRGLLCERWLQQPIPYNGREGVACLKS